MENLKQRAVQAAERFLHHRGYDVVDVGWKSPPATSTSWRGTATTWSSSR